MPTLFNVHHCERPKVYARLFEAARDDMVKRKNGCSYELDKLWSAMLKIKRFAITKEVTTDSVTMNVTDGPSDELSGNSISKAEGLSRTVICKSITFNDPVLHPEEGKNCNTSIVEISCDGSQRCRCLGSGGSCGKQVEALYEACMKYAKDS